MKLKLPRTPQTLLCCLSFPQLSAARWQKLLVTHRRPGKFGVRMTLVGVSASSFNLAHCKITHLTVSSYLAQNCQFIYKQTYF